MLHVWSDTNVTRSLCVEARCLSFFMHVHSNTKVSAQEWRLQFSFIMLKKTHVLEDGFCMWFKVQDPTSLNPIAEAFSSTKAPPGSSLVSFSTRTMKSTRNMRLCIYMWILGVNWAGLSSSVGNSSIFPVQFELLPCLRNAECKSG